MLIALSLIVCCIWIYLTFARGSFWSVRKAMLPERHCEGLQSLRIVAVVPARNEAEVIGQAVTGLLAQNLELQVVLVDDQSSDGTASMARNAARELQLSDRLHVITADNLPRGWTGKMWAVHQGVVRAMQLNPDYLLLTDADILHEPNSVAQMAAVAETTGYDLTSCMVMLATDTWAERFLIPAFVYFFFQLYPPAWITDPRRKTAGAAGGCILLCPGALQAAGGIEAIKSEIIDDCALARNVKRAGGRVALFLSGRSRSIRSYQNFRGVVRMIARSAFNQLRYSYLLLGFTVAGLIVTYVIPAGLATLGNYFSMGCGLFAWLLMSYTFFPMGRLYGQPWVFSLVLPFIALVYGGATIASAWQYARGTGGQWKGRIQAPNR